VGFWGWLRSHHVALAFVAILAVGVFLRVWQFPTVPDGLNQDEISAAYEAKSLLETGADRWGARWPAYFLSWGSGQNVLYSYLTIPVVWVLGPTAVAVRLVALIFGIATVPLMFAAVRPYAGATGGLLAMAFTAIVPWHFMLSRWGVESNLLPFWLLLGVVLVERAARRDRPLGIALSLLPFAVALYAYAVAAIVLLLLVPLLVVGLRSDIRRRLWWWVGAAGASLLVAIPFLLFLLKSEILHRSLPFESALPFSLPTLTTTRLVQLAQHSTPGGIWSFIGGLFYDGQPEDTLPGMPPLSAAIVVLAVIGTIFAIVRAVQTRARDVSPFLLMVIACVPLFLAIPDVDDSRINPLFLPLVALAATGLMDLLGVVRIGWARVALVGVTVVVVVTTSIYAATIYFSPTYTAYAAPEYYPGFGAAIKAAARASGTDELFVTNTPSLNYVQVLWYLDIPSRTFAASNPTPSDPDFGRFIFARKRIDRAVPYYYLISATNDRPPCLGPTVLWAHDDWVIGRCAALPTN
jgi:uncharacterized membrane protein